MSRPFGSVNRRTTERKLALQHRADGIPLAKEMLEELAIFYFKAAMQLMPKLPLRDDDDPDKLRKFHSMAEKCAFYARSLAPYQSPTFRSITVQAPRDKEAHGTPAIDALESFMITLAAVRRREPDRPPVIDNDDDDTPTLVAVKSNGG
jgi:hypothetical protein